MFKLFFDESGKEVAITNKGDTLNILHDKSDDTFVGVYVGCDSSILAQEEAEYLEVEHRLREREKLNQTIEIKSTHRKQKFFKYGISTFDTNLICFYEDLFHYLDRPEFTIHIVSISKIEEYIRFLMPQLPFEYNNYSYDLIVYILSKFFLLYSTPELIGSLYEIKSRKDVAQFYRVLNKNLDSLIESYKTVPRLQKGVHSFKELSQILKHINPPIRSSPRLQLDSKRFLSSIILLLEELNIEPDCVKFIIDGDIGTYPGIVETDNLHYGDSKSFPLIRVCDNIAGFISRMIKSLEKKLISSELSLDEVNTASYEEKDRLRILDPEWFILSERQFSLYQLIFHVIVESRQYEYTIATSSFSDSTILFVSLLKYFGAFESYREYNNVTSKEHPERFNQIVIRELEFYYQRHLSK